MAVSYQNDQLALVVSSADHATSSYEGLLKSQKELLSKQIDQLQDIVSTQCKLTGVNPLSQEMAAGALSIKIGKRPRDLLNPKAIKYMQSIFSVKDEISKKEIRTISALFGLTATQVREFFTGQRSRVRRFIRLSREKAIQLPGFMELQDGPSCSNLGLPITPVPLNSMGPSSTEAPLSFMHAEILLGIDDKDKDFVANIFNLLRKEETFSGQVKLLEWILQIQNASLLSWFLTNGGVMILATWLSQAAMEEQTTVLHVILRVLCHLPLHKALPAHMSAILQSVNKLRFYRGSDISNRAKTLLSRWSKLFARTQAMRKPNTSISATDAQNEMLLKQSIGEILESESMESRVDTSGEMLLLQENSENARNLGSSQSIKLLTGPSDDSNKKLLRGVSSSHTKERRKVQLVEQPGQKVAGRSTQVQRSVSTTQGRPLSADDIQKAKMRAQFMRSKYGESYRSPQMKIEAPRASSISQASTTLSASKVNVQPKFEEHMSSISAAGISVLASKARDQPKVEEHVSSSSQASITLKTSEVHVQPKVQEHMSSSCQASLTVSATEAEPKVEEHEKPLKLVSESSNQLCATVHGNENLDSEEPVWKKCKRFQISWVTPPEIKINEEWSVCSGENSKEVEIQNNRIRREKEIFYQTDLDIPANPKEPWDREMDYDDSLTPEIPTEQLPDNDNVVEEEISAHENLDYAITSSHACATTSEHSNRNMPEPDLELLAVLLKNPEIVFALTSGQGGNLSSEQTVKLLDAIKANGVSGGGSVGNLINGLVGKKTETVEVSLPSPTPSSNPVTIGWRQESAKNPFSRQNVTVNGEAYAIPGVAFQENHMPSPTVPSLNQQPIMPAIHQRFPGMVTDERIVSDLVPDQRAISVAVGPSKVYFSSRPGGLQIQRQQQTVTSEPRLLPAQSWSVRQGLASTSYLSADQGANYNSYIARDFVQPGGSWVRNGGYRGEPGYESWSPDNSPDKSHEYVAEWDYSEPGANMVHSRNQNYWPEMSRMQHNSSGYRDHGGGRSGITRWHDRRR